MFGLFGNNKENEKDKDNKKKEESIINQTFEIHGEKLGETKYVTVDDNGNGYKSIYIRNSR